MVMIIFLVVFGFCVRKECRAILGDENQSMQANNTMQLKEKGTEP